MKYLDLSFTEPAKNLACDEALLTCFETERRATSLLRIWQPENYFVVLGHSNKLRAEVDVDQCHKAGVAVARRISGGGAMFIEPGNTITYSIYAPLSLINGLSFRAAYAFMDEWVLAALAELGIKAWYQPLNDITSAGGKIAGAAQVHRAGAVLHHVTMAYDIDAAKMLDVLRIGREKLSDKGTLSAAKRVDPLRSQTGLPRAAVIDRMIATFRRLHGLHDDVLRPQEVVEARALAASKFSTAAWTADVP